MTRQYWSGHKKHEGLITNNQHIAALLINNFRQPEIPIEEHEPYRRWKNYLALNPANRKQIAKLEQMKF